MNCGEANQGFHALHSLKGMLKPADHSIKE
jgi:hypothetical protein